MARKATTATRPTSWWPHEAAWKTPEQQHPKVQDGNARGYGDGGSTSMHTGMHPHTLDVFPGAENHPSKASTLPKGRRQDGCSRRMGL